MSLIGWSLGGVYARELAKLAVDDVRLVITLGSPFKGNTKATHATKFYERFSDHTVEEARVTANVQFPPAHDSHLQPQRRCRRMAVLRRGCRPPV